MSDSFQETLDRMELAREPDELSGTFVAVLPVTGASVATVGELFGSETLSATDARAARLDELQFDLSQGPCWDALGSAQPILEPDIGGEGLRRWPAFAGAARDHDIRSVFAFPLIVGSLRIGAVDLYSDHPVELSPQQSREASAMAEIVGRHVLRDALAGTGAQDETAVGPFSRRRIHQATGFVLAQLAIPPQEARLIIQGHAFAAGRSMMEVAEDIIEGRLRFERRDGRIEVAP